MEELSCRFSLLHPVEKREIASISLSFDAAGGGDGLISVSVESGTSDRLSCRVFYTSEQMTLFLSELTDLLEGGCEDARIKDYESRSAIVFHRQNPRFYTLALTIDNDFGDGCVFMSSFSGALVENESVSAVALLLRHWLRVNT